MSGDVWEYRPRFRHNEGRIFNEYEITNSSIDLLFDVIDAMCTLYSQVKAQAEIRAIINAISDGAGNLRPQPAIFPDSVAPVVRETTAGRELTRMRWGIPGPVIHGGRPLMNVRNVASGFWKPYLMFEQRCLVPATSFCEYAEKPDPKTKKKIPTWFALSKDRPLFFFAGIWRKWTGTRGTKAEPVVGDHLLYSFLTCEPNKVVKPMHSIAMPVILTTPKEWEQWLKAPLQDALKLQRPLPDKLLQIVASGEKKDGH